MKSLSHSTTKKKNKQILIQQIEKVIESVNPATRSIIKKHSWKQPGCCAECLDFAPSIGNKYNFSYDK
jgi:hypothetical protein